MGLRVRVAVLVCVPYLPSLSAWSASSRGAHVGAHRSLVARVHCPTLSDESTDESTENPPDKLVNLVLQCAIQAQLSYYAEFKNEIRTRWLEAFLGHEHLGVQRVSDRGSGVIKYRGLSGGMRCSWRDYLLTMLRGKQESYSCRYKVGTADVGGLPRPSADAPSASADAPWAAASASRAANPYLQKEEVQYREFIEIIAPSRIANGLMSISAQLADEWSTDLEYVATEGAYLLEQCEDMECVICMHAACVCMLPVYAFCLRMHACCLRMHAACVCMHAACVCMHAADYACTPPAYASMLPVYGHCGMRVCIPGTRRPILVRFTFSWPGLAWPGLA